MTSTIHEIARLLGIPVPEGADLAITGWSIDSRTVQPGDAFFAIAGPNHDGHNHVQAAFDRGAALAVISKHVATTGPTLLVENTETALQTLAAAMRRTWSGIVVAVTGSAGKTSTKDAIATLASAQFITGRTIGNLNNHLGLPLSILRLPDNAQVAVLEMGMNHAGEIRALAQIGKPDIGVVTNVGWAHAENFPEGIEGVALAKRELIEALGPGGTAILNADDPRVADFAQIHPGRTIYYGFDDLAAVRAENLVTTSNGTTFHALGQDFDSPLAGRHSVSNTLAAIAVVQALGIALEKLPAAVRNLAAGHMRGERSEHEGVTIVNDCYNSNPEAAHSMLELLRGIPARRHIAVLGEMLELGREAESLHRSTGKFAAGGAVDVLVGIRGAARFMVDEALKSGMSDGAAIFFDTPEQAGQFIRTVAQPGDAVLFKGSRGVQVERALAQFVGTGN